MCKLSDFDHLKLDSCHAEILRNELDLWHRTRLPLKIKNVLDIGAGNGESAQFYLNHGAEHVLSVEPYADFLKINFEDDARVTIWPFPADFINLDCEGGEKNMLVEVHFPHRFHYLTNTYFPDNVSIVRLEEYWGNKPRKAARLLTKKALFPFCKRFW